MYQVFYCGAFCNCTSIAVISVVLENYQWCQKHTYQLFFESQIHHGLMITRTSNDKTMIGIFILHYIASHLQFCLCYNRSFPLCHIRPFPQLIFDIFFIKQKLSWQYIKVQLSERDHCINTSKIIVDRREPIHLKKLSTLRVTTENWQRNGEKFAAHQGDLTTVIIIIMKTWYSA